MRLRVHVSICCLQRWRSIASYAIHLVWLAELFHYKDYNFFCFSHGGPTNTKMLAPVNENLTFIYLTLFRMYGNCLISAPCPVLSKTIWMVSDWVGIPPVSPMWFSSGWKNSQSTPIVTKWEAQVIQGSINLALMPKKKKKMFALKYHRSTPVGWYAVCTQLFLSLKFLYLLFYRCHRSDVFHVPHRIGWNHGTNE